MNQAIANIIKNHISGLDFVDKIAGLVSACTFDIVVRDKENNPTTVQKTFPIACCLSEKCAIETAYQDLMPNSDYKTVIYFEDKGVSWVKTEGRYKHYTSNVRLVCWINVAKILGDTCKEGDTCTLSTHLITEIIRSLPEFPGHHNPFNMVFSEVIDQEVRSPSIFSTYTYDEKHSQYLMYPYDYFALDMQTSFAICMNGTQVYNADCSSTDLDNLDIPVATEATNINANSFTANWETVLGATGYAIDVSTDPNFTDFVLQDARVGNALSVSITNLDPDATYYYRVRAYNDYTESENSNAINLKTVHAGSGAVDADGNAYTSVIIGTQEWLVENLRTTKYNDGTPIPNLILDADWIAEDGNGGHDGAYCVHNNDPLNIPDYGLLYNWYAVDNAHGLAPTGWRVPGDADFNTLVAFLGGDTVAGGKLKETGLAHWTAPNTGATDEVGFRSLPAGGRNWNDGLFGALTLLNSLWSSDGSNRYYLAYSNASMMPGSVDAKSGMTVRCMRDV